MVDVPVVQFVLEGFHFLNKVVDMLVGVQLRGVAESCGKLRSFRSCSSSTSLVHVPVVMQRLVPMVQTVQLGLEAWAAHYCDDELLFFLRALYRGTGPGGRVHKDTAPTIRCIYWRLSTKTFVKSSIRTTTTTTTTQASRFRG